MILHDKLDFAICEELSVEGFAPSNSKLSSEKDGIWISRALERFGCSIIFRSKRSLKVPKFLSEIFSKSALNQLEEL